MPKEPFLLTLEELISQDLEFFCRRLPDGPGSGDMWIPTDRGILLTGVPATTLIPWLAMFQDQELISLTMVMCVDGVYYEFKTNRVRL